MTEPKVNGDRQPLGPPLDQTSTDQIDHINTLVENLLISAQTPKPQIPAV
jgi:hypothetical protein